MLLLNIVTIQIQQRYLPNNQFLLRQTVNLLPSYKYYHFSFSYLIIDTYYILYNNTLSFEKCIELIKLTNESCSF